MSKRYKTATERLYRSMAELHCVRIKRLYILQSIFARSTMRSFNSPSQKTPVANFCFSFQVLFWKSEHLDSATRIRDALYSSCFSSSVTQASNSATWAIWAFKSTPACFILVLGSGLFCIDLITEEWLPINGLRCAIFLRGNTCLHNFLWFSASLGTQ